MTTAAAMAAVAGVAAAGTTMTEPRRPAPVKRPGPLPVAATALAAFLALLALLASQVRAGRDPALGPAEQRPAPAPRRVVVHRVIETRVVGRDAPAAAPSTPAPQATAPAPAPAPAPVVTRSS